MGDQHLWRATLFNGDSDVLDPSLLNETHSYESCSSIEIISGHVPASLKLRQLIKTSSRIIVCPGGRNDGGSEKLRRHWRYLSPLVGTTSDPEFGWSERAYSG